MREVLLGMLDTVRRDPWRAVLTLCGVALGTASIVFLVSLLGGAEVALGTLEHKASGSDLNRVNVEEPQVPPAQTVLPLVPADAHALRARAGEARTEMIYKYRLRRVDARVSDRTKRVGLEGGGSDYARLLELELLHGRWLAPEEDGERRCMIGYDVWMDLYEGRWPVQERMVLDNSVSLAVVGVFAHRPSPGGGDGPQTWRLDRKVWVSNRTFQLAIEPRVSVDEIVLRHAVVDGELPDVQALARVLDRYLVARHRGVRNFAFAALDAEGDKIGDIISFAIGGVLSLAALFSLLVGGVNVMNAELMKLAERTREYGIRRAVGATAARLARELVGETVMFCALGGVLGVGLGIAGAWLLSVVLTAVLAEWPFVVQAWSVWLAAAAALLVGLLAGIAPARRAKRLNVVECLRQAG